MFGGRRRADVRLQRDVAEILERDDAELGRVAEDPRHRHGHRAEQLRDVHERQRLEINRPRMDGKHLRWAVAKQDAEIAPVRRIAGELHDLGLAGARFEPGQKPVDPFARVDGVCRKAI